MIHRHHRVLGNREDNRPVNIMLVDDEVHRWIHSNPEKAMELGWIVSKHDDPENVSVCIPKTILAEPEKKPRQRKASTPEERKARKQFNIQTPKGEENLLPEYVQLGREVWAEELGWSDTVPSYFVVLTAFVKALQ